MFVFILGLANIRNVCDFGPAGALLAGLNKPGADEHNDTRLLSSRSFLGRGAVVNSPPLASSLCRPDVGTLAPSGEPFRGKNLVHRIHGTARKHKPARPVLLVIVVLDLPPVQMGLIDVQAVRPPERPLLAPMHCGGRSQGPP